MKSVKNQRNEKHEQSEKETERDIVWLLTNSGEQLCGPQFHDRQVSDGKQVKWGVQVFQIFK